MNKKHIHVTCAIIERDGLVLAAQRSRAMSLPLKWEFPGGKIRPDESPKECICREILEELEITIYTSKPLQPATYCYPSLTVTLYPFICSIIAGEIQLNEHADIIWMPPNELAVLDWAEADLPVLANYCQQLKKQDYEA